MARPRTWRERTNREGKNGRQFDSDPAIGSEIVFFEPRNGQLIRHVGKVGGTRQFAGTDKLEFQVQYNDINGEPMITWIEAQPTSHVEKAFRNLRLMNSRCPHITATIIQQVTDAN